VSDLIGGALVGGMLLQAVIVFDRATARIRAASRIVSEQFNRRPTAPALPLLGPFGVDRSAVAPVPTASGEPIVVSPEEATSGSLRTGTRG
jgi:hypothetical protein